MAGGCQELSGAGYFGIGVINLEDIQVNVNIDKPFSEICRINKYLMLYSVLVRP